MMQKYKKPTIELIVFKYSSVAASSDNYFEEEVIEETELLPVMTELNWGEDTEMIIDEEIESEVLEIESESIQEES